MLKRVAIHDETPFIRATTAGLTIKLAGLYRTAGGMSRVHQWLESDKGMIIITCWRKENPLATNKSRFAQMPAEIRGLLNSKEVGGYWLIGHWRECSKTIKEKIPSGMLSKMCQDLGGVLRDSLEFSWMFLQPPDMDSKAWFEAAKTLAQKYEQETFILRANGETAATLYNADGDVYSTLTTAGAVTEAMQNLTCLRAHMESFGYSELKNVRMHGYVQPIVFMTASKNSSYPVLDADPDACPLDHGPAAISFYTAKPHNNSSSAAFKHLGVFIGD